ncbi:hypothetical protein CIHG_02654 [Coccidioides immitis H538.4]|uniref:Uncharacterized protein n=1 Tax=Coccidioides immitis H538.4 TaxID=396776 RepID=A0A0J8RJM9_COCIT|nr:hypothetical protein CIHG_02654 [Coccidioides immitis H538.4]
MSDPKKRSISGRNRMGFSQPLPPMDLASARDHDAPKSPSFTCVQAQYNTAKPGRYCGASNEPKIMATGSQLGARRMPARGSSVASGFQPLSGMARGPDINPTFADAMRGPKKERAWQH